MWKACDIMLTTDWVSNFLFNTHLNSFLEKYIKLSWRLPILAMTHLRVADLPHQKTNKSPVEYYKLCEGIAKLPW